MIVKSIEVDSSRRIYCTGYQDGRIKKIFLKKNQQTIFVCEECEATWLSLEDIFDDSKGEGLMDYLEELGCLSETGRTVWSEVLELGDFVTFDEVADIVKKHGIEVEILE